ncbi:MAG TPA: methyltransferase, partial [Gaiellaceae bacterium]|nr:methyltransferase [Gaiellaceae bacterium]
ALAGAVIVVLAARALGRGLTPLPRPPARAGLVQHGPFRVVRHPTYAGALALFAGVALALSPLALAPLAALAVIWALKAAVEERFLRARFPGYAAYAERTRWRLLPFVY